MVQATTLAANPGARIGAAFARISGAPSSFNIARRLTKAEAERQADAARATAKARGWSYAFGVHVSDDEPR